MEPPDPIDLYFTEHIVGPTAVVQLGKTASVRRQPKRGVMLDMLKDQPQLMGLAAKSLLSKDPVRAIVGRPVSLPGLRNWRRLWVALGFTGWTAALVVALRYWPR